MHDFDPRDTDDRERDRWNDLERGREPRDRDEEREVDDARDAARDVFTRDLDLPDGPHRELVRVHEHVYELNGDDARALANIGAFRVVQARDLSDHDDGPTRDTLNHLEDEGLVQVIPMESRDRDIVALTEEGRELLVEHQRDDRAHAQEFYAEAVKPRELTHDAHVYRAYLRTAERLEEEGARIDRVVLDYELKHDYQTFLQERNRDQSDSDGRRERTALCDRFESVGLHLGADQQIKVLHRSAPLAPASLRAGQNASDVYTERAAERPQSWRSSRGFGVAGSRRISRRGSPGCREFDRADPLHERRETVAT